MNLQINDSINYYGILIKLNKFYTEYSWIINAWMKKLTDYFYKLNKNKLTFKVFHLQN